ncbi:MAG: hypothetical protein AB8G05_08885 [Oligoflexales bacterium]
MRDRSLFTLLTVSFYFTSLIAIAGEIQKKEVYGGDIDSIIKECPFIEDHDLFFVHPSYFETCKSSLSSWTRYGIFENPIKKIGGDPDTIHIYQLDKYETKNGWNSGDPLFFFDTENTHSLKDTPKKEVERYMTTLLTGI